MAAARGSLEIEDVVRQYFPVVYRYALRLSGAASDADDLTQQTFLIACQRLDQVRDAERVDRWLLAVTRTNFLKVCRRARTAPTVPLDEAQEELADVGAAPDYLDRELLAAALSRLPTEYRVVVLMFYFEELSYTEIAAQLDIPMGTVMSRLARAKSRLRSALQPPEMLSPKRAGRSSAECASPVMPACSERVPAIANRP